MLFYIYHNPNYNKKGVKPMISDQHYKLLNKKIESSETANDNKTNQDNVGNANKTHISKRSPI